MIETFNDALIECVRACGGSKQVGPKLFPEKPPEAAQRHLLDCLNSERTQHLTPEQALLVMRMAREVGNHAGMRFLSEDLSYTMPTPIEPRDEADELRRLYIDAARRMAKIAERIEVLDRPALRSAA